MMLKRVIWVLKTSPLMMPVLGLIDFLLFCIDRIAILSTPRPKQQPLSLLIIRLDVLGDYLMFRSYLHQIKKSARYQQHRLTFLGNVAVRSVAETFDNKLIDEFIWTDIYKLSTNPIYRFQFVRQLRRRGFSAVFCPTYSRVLVLDDFLASATGASERVGCLTDFVNIKHWEAWFGDKLYTRLIPSASGLLFELERNRQIVQGFLEEPLPLMTPVLDATRAKAVTMPTPVVVLSLGAGQDFRVWPARLFAEVAQYILKAYPEQHILLTGAPSEMSYANDFLMFIPESDRVINLTGKLSIAELIYVLSKADLLIANETGVVHLAASTKTSTIVISQGKSLVRWHPYSAPLDKQIQHLYPDYVEQHREDLSAIAPSFNPESPCSITEITVDRVIRAVNERLTAKPQVS